MGVYFCVFLFVGLSRLVIWILVVLGLLILIVVYVDFYFLYMLVWKVVVDLKIFLGRLDIVERVMIEVILVVVIGLDSLLVKFSFFRVLYIGVM